MTTPSSILNWAHSGNSFDTMVCVGAVPYDLCEVTGGWDLLQVAGQPTFKRWLPLVNPPPH
jgi:hypothetical protein